MTAAHPISGAYTMHSSQMRYLGLNSCHPVRSKALSFSSIQAARTVIPHDNPSSLKTPRTQHPRSEPRKIHKELYPHKFNTYSSRAHGTPLPRRHNFVKIDRRITQPPLLIQVWANWRLDFGEGLLLLTHSHLSLDPAKEQGELTAGYRWTGGVWEMMNRLEVEGFGEKKNSWFQRSLWNIPHIITGKNRKIRACNRLGLDLGALGFWPIILPQISPDTGPSQPAAGLTPHPGATWDKSGTFLNPANKLHTVPAGTNPWLKKLALAAAAT